MNRSNCTAINGSTCTESLDAVSIICLPIINSILAVMATTENTFVLIAICKLTALHTNSNKFLVSLAMADLMVGLIMNPVIAIRSSLNILGNVKPLAVFAECMCLQAIAATMFSLLAVSVDRYLSVTIPFRYPELVTQKRIICAVSTCWTLTLVFPAVRLSITDISVLPELWAGAIVVTFFLPIILISYCYFHIWNVAKAQTRTITSQTVLERRRTTTIAKNAKAAWTVAIVIGVCVLLWTPSIVIGVVQNAIEDDCSKRQMNATWLWGITIAFAMSSVNPIIYCFRGREFKNAYRNVLGFQLKEERESTAVATHIFHVKVKPRDCSTT